MPGEVLSASSAARFVTIKAGEGEIGRQRLKISEFQREQFQVPLGFLMAAVIHQATGFHLRLRETGGGVDWHLGKLELLRRQEADPSPITKGLWCKISGVGENGECPDLFQLMNCSPVAISMRRLWCCACGGT